MTPAPLPRICYQENSATFQKPLAQQVEILHMILINGQIFINFNFTRFIQQSLVVLHDPHMTSVFFLNRLAD
jgi:hypothetical protein